MYISISIISIFIDNNIQKRIQFQESKKTENGSDQNDLENEEMKGFQNGIMEPFWCIFGGWKNPVFCRKWIKNVSPWWIISGWDSRSLESVKNFFQKIRFSEIQFSIITTRKIFFLLSGFMLSFSLSPIQMNRDN